MEGHSVIQPPSKFPTIRWVLVTLFIVGQHQCTVKCLSLQIFLLQITRQEVNHFSSGKNIPKCELLLVLDQDTPPAPLHHLFDLVGAGDRSYFLLHINPGKYYNGHSDKFTDTVLAAGSCCSEVQWRSQAGAHWGTCPSNWRLCPTSAGAPEIISAECTVINHELGAKSVQRC